LRRIKNYFKLKDSKEIRRGKGLSNRLIHLVFYDGNCGLCDYLVQFIIGQDKQKQFVFAPLFGETASQYLNNLSLDLRYEDSLILIENYQSPNRQYYLLSKAAFKIAWQLGGYWKIPGALFFLPAFLFDWLYRLVALYRHHFISNKTCNLPLEDQKSRFLP
jgi:predicted DCC family thiol-disulfide oxidoreductase YuxK